MEHRLHPRVRTALPAILAHRGKRLGTFRTRDVSLGGLFLNTGPTGLARNAPLELRLLAQGHNQAIHGCVAHLAAEGLGVMVTDPGPQYANIVLEAMSNSGATTQDIGPAGNRRRPGPAAQNGAAAQEDGDADLVIRTGDPFDMVACRQFVRAARRLQDQDLDQVVVDLGATRQVLDSGIALLRMLRDQAGGDGQRVRLVNCSGPVRQRLEQAGIPLA